MGVKQGRGRGGGGRGGGGGIQICMDTEQSWGIGLVVSYPRASGRFR